MVVSPSLGGGRRRPSRRNNACVFKYPFCGLGRRRVGGINVECVRVRDSETLKLFEVVTDIRNVCVLQPFAPVGVTFAAAASKG